jgi:hypothetical protein
MQKHLLQLWEEAPLQHSVDTSIDWFSQAYKR